MTSSREIVTDWKGTCEALALGYLESDNSQDASDYAHECADGVRWVIFYDYAWELVSAVRRVHSKCMDQAESELEDLGFSFESIDKTMSSLAYWLTYNEILTQINEQEESNND